MCKLSIETETRENYARDTNNKRREINFITWQGIPNFTYSTVKITVPSSGLVYGMYSL